LPLQPKRCIAKLKICPHGGLNYNELQSLGIDADAIIDFSVSTNPFMPPPRIRDKMKDFAIERYPDSQSSVLRQRLAEKIKIAPENMLVGSGTTEIIGLIALTYFRQRDPVLILEPTYGEYEVAVRIAGARPVKYRATEKDYFVPKMDKVIEIIRQRRPRAVFMCNPNNPTGKYLSRADIESVVEALGDTLLVLDEAYVAFVGKSWSSLDLIERGNVIVMRSMTKDYGLPGLRLGYAAARKDIIDTLRLVAPPWNVNVIAQEAGIAALKQEEYLKESLGKVRESKQYLTKELSRLGFSVTPSDAHYFLVKVGNAPECRRALLKYGIMVRDCTSFGLPEYIRVSPRAMPECEKLIKAFTEILRSGEGAFEDPSV
jgi:histidinol-phosphate aminotransferase